LNAFNKKIWLTPVCVFQKWWLKFDAQ